MFIRTMWDENIKPGSICKQVHRGKEVSVVTVLRFIPRTRTYHVYNPVTFEDYYLDVWELLPTWCPNNNGGT